MKAMFQEADIDGNGKLDKAELGNFIFKFTIKHGCEILSKERQDPYFFRELYRTTNE